MSEQVWARMREMLAGSLQYYANESRCDEDGQDTATMLEELAGRIADGTATEEDYLEAIDQCDVSDSW